MIILMMAMDEKTEKPTPKKRKDTREKGQVVKSNDLSAAFILLAMFGTLRIFGGDFIEKIESVLAKYFTLFGSSSEPLSLAGISSIFIDLILSLFLIIAPILLASVIISLIVNYFQVGFLFTTKTLEMKFSKINPLEGFKKIFSMRSVVEMLKSNLKFFILAYILYLDIKKSFGVYPTLMGSEIVISLKYIVSMTMSIAFKMGITLFALGVFDYLYQWWEHEKNLRMTKKEIKEELRQIEGDPKVKSKIKQKQMQIGMARMMSDVPKADVVITNPTHYAIALKYDDKTNNAPIVLAKGKDFVAQKIKEKAREHKIQLVENKPLAQALFATVEIGEQIPQEFYAAVAEILVKIYSIKR